jgi:hypothetical protein
MYKLLLPILGLYIKEESVNSIHLTGSLTGTGLHMHSSVLSDVFPMALFVRKNGLRPMKSKPKRIEPFSCFYYIIFYNIIIIIIHFFFFNPTPIFILSSRPLPRRPFRFCSGGAQWLSANPLH